MLLPAAQAVAFLLIFRYVFSVADDLSHCLFDRPAPAGAARGGSSPDVPWPTPVSSP